MRSNYIAYTFTFCDLHVVVTVRALLVHVVFAVVVL